MIDYVRTTPNHLVYIHEQQDQKFDVSFMLSPAALPGFSYSMALSGFDGTKCLGCAGLIEGKDRVMLWALLSKDAGPYFLEITRKVNRVLSMVKGKPFVACVRPGFKQGQRWMKVLGFKKIKDSVQIEGYPEGAIMDVFEREAE